MKQILIILACILFSSCASPGAAYNDNAPGFWLGLWHGTISTFALIGHIFDLSIRVYAAPNTGGWYDLGFLLGCGTFVSSGARERRRLNKRRY
jgi:hypothetical protein